MSNKLRLLTSLFILILFSACSAPPSHRDRQALKRDPAWPAIRAVAQRQIAEREGELGWRLVRSAQESDALYPAGKSGEIWRVVACADYPGNTLGEIVEMEISTNGNLLRYTRQWETKR